MMQNYPQLIDRISRASGLNKEDIERRVEAKRAKLSGLISKEGAAQIVAAELGINFEKQKSKLNELMAGMKRVNAIGKVIKLFPVREFNKNGRQGKVANMIIADDTANTKVVLWDVNHIKLIETGEIKEGSVIDVSNASMRDSEIHLSGFSDIKLSEEVIEHPVTERSFSEKKIADAKSGETIKTRAFIVQAFEPRFFEVCPECNSKAVRDGEMGVCEKHGRIVPSKRALLNIVLDDGSESIRTVLFHDQIGKLGISAENFAVDRETIMGKEAFFSGTVRLNKVFNNTEFVVNDVENIDIDNLIVSLEKAL